MKPTYPTNSQGLDNEFGLTPSDYEAGLNAAVTKAQTDFLTFFLLFNPPGGKIVLGALHRYLIQLIQDVVDGVKGKRQSVSVPPQHGKSYILSTYAIAWLLGHTPGIQIAITGFSNTLLYKFSREIRDVISSPLYLMIFPGRKIRDDCNRMDEWELEDGGGIVAKSTGTKLTGRRVDWLVIDDPHSGREEAESKTYRDKVESWYYADCVTRLAPDATIFIVATRWHPDDLIGKLTSEDKVAQLTADSAEDEVFEVTNLPAICEDAENDPLHRKVGDALFPEVRTAKFLKGKRATQPDYEWASQYQGRPKAAGSGQVDLTKIKYINREFVPIELDHVRAWDLALTEKQTSDYTAGARMCYDPDQDKLYIVDMFRNRGTWVKNRKIILDKAESEIDEGVLRLSIEAVAGFLAPAQDLHATLLGRVVVRAKNPPRGGKLARALPWLNKVEAGSVYLVRAPWNKDFLAELEMFPEGEHDDQIDAVSIGWETLVGSNRNGTKQPKPGSTRPSGRSRQPGGTARPTSANNRPSRQTTREELANSHPDESLF